MFNRQICSAVAAVAFTVPAGIAQAQVEGVATFVTRTEHGQKTDTVYQTTKGKSLRMDGFGGGNRGGGMIIDGEKNRLIVLDASQKTAMVMTREDQERMRAMTEGMLAGRKKPAADKDLTEPAITKTGRTETVAGVRCEWYHVVTDRKDQKQEGDACIGEVGFGIFQALMNNPMMHSAQSNRWEHLRKMVSEGKGLVKATTIEDGKSYVSLELIKFERKSVPASTFEPPAGYKIQSMGDMLQKASGAMDQLKKLRPRP